MRATRHMMEIVLNRKLRRAEMRFADRHHVRIHVSHTNQIIAVRHSYNGFAGMYRAFFPSLSRGFVMDFNTICDILPGQ